MVRDQHDAVRLVRELIGVDVFAEVPFADGDADGLGDGIEPIPLQLDQPIAHRSRPIVELGGRRDEKQPPREPAPLRPRQPVFE